MDQYTLMRLSEEMDDDAVEPDELVRQQGPGTDRFREDYRAFYDDVKFFPKEDW